MGLLLIFLIPFVFHVILDHVLFPLHRFSGFVVCCLMVVYHMVFVDLCLLRWEIKFRRVLRRIFFVPAVEDEFHDETYGSSSFGSVFYQVLIKNVLILSCESCIIDSSSPIKAGATGLLLRFATGLLLRSDGPIEIQVMGFGIRDSGYRIRYGNYLVLTLVCFGLLL